MSKDLTPGVKLISSHFLLNSENEIPVYEKMISGKWKFVNAVFNLHQTEILKDRNFKKFVKDNGGGENGATIMSPEIYRPDWVKVKDYFKGKKPLSSLGCK